MYVRETRPPRLNKLNTAPNQLKNILQLYMPSKVDGRRDSEAGRAEARRAAETKP